jgi:hypothetical protein
MNFKNLHLHSSESHDTIRSPHPTQPRTQPPQNHDRHRSLLHLQFQTLPLSTKPCHKYVILRGRQRASTKLETGMPASRCGAQTASWSIMALVPSRKPATSLTSPDIYELYLKFEKDSESWQASSKTFSGTLSKASLKPERDRQASLPGMR